MVAIEHSPERPSWHCRACGEPWPCAPAREQLVEETGGGTILAIQCWVYFDLYVRDMGNGPLGEAFQRFIGWAR
jgi:hypothetical protein